MKINRRKIIALVTLFSMFMASLIPAKTVNLLSSAPEVVIEVEEIEEPDTSETEKNDKDGDSGNGSAVDEKEADNKDKSGSAPLTEGEKTDKEEDSQTGSAFNEKETDNKDKPDSEAPATTQKPEKETDKPAEATEAPKDTDKPAETTEAPKDTEKPEKETATEAVIDTEKPEEPKTEAPTETAKPEEPETETPAETATAMPTAKPETEKETAKPTAKPEGTEKPEDDRLIIQGSTHEHNKIEFTEWTAADSLPTTAGNYCLAGDVTISSTWNVPSGETKLCLNGHGIRMTGSGSVVSVGSGKTLAIYDEANEGKISGGSVTSGGGAVTVDAGSLILNGGVISGNKTTGTAKGESAGGIYLKNSASFLMNGGEISGNTSASQGGAICTDQTAVTVDIAGGEIKNNTAAHWASAIWAGRHSSAQFIIRNDAKIIDNISLDGSGTINVADTQNYIISGDPAISGKSNSGSGQNTHLNLDGNDSGLYQKVELSGPLTNDTGTPKITICAIHNTLSSGVTYVFTKNWSTYMGSANPAKYFRLDSSVTGLKIVRKDGEAAIASSGDKYVFFDPNGGTGTMDSQLVTAENTTLTGNTFARDNYSFGGWNTKADGTGTDYTDKASITLSGDLTLYAQWKKNLFDGKGTEEQPYLIKSADDWDALSAHINGGGTKYSGCYFKLTNNISVTTVLGNRPNNNTDSEDYFFSGTFDGDGHTLNVNISNSGFAAPFAIAHNATIKNLHVTGTVTSSSNHAAGLVAASKSRSGIDQSSLTIQNVTVSTDISCNSHVAGIVGHAHNANITMENVVFDGSISASSVQGGFIGWGGSSNSEKFSASFKDCLFAGTYRSGTAFYPVAFASGQGTVTLLNDFYTTSLGSGGSPITPTGDGQVKLLAAMVEKDGAVKYFDSFDAAAGSANWTEGSTLKLMTDVSVSSTVNIPSGKHSLDLNGHGIKMTGSGSVIRVGSGAVFELCDSGTGATHKFDVPDGAGLAALNESGGNYTLNGGYITGGTGLSGQGGGVYVNGGTFTLTAGTIIGNQVQNEGGGVFVASGSFSMNGGAIIYNKSTGHWGGGINVAGPFTMSGGSISHNYAGVGAGGVHCHALTMTGGSVTDNQSASNYAGGVNVSNTATLSGNVIITGNTNSSGNNNLYCQSVVISDKLSEDASIGITLPNGTGVFTSGLSGKGSAKNFTSDNSAYIVSQNANGEAELKADSHEHDGVSFTKWTSTDSLPAEAGNYCLAGDVTISSRWDVPSGTTNLCLNGHAIIRTGGQETTGSVIQVGSGATLNLYDCGTETRYYTVANPTANGAGLGTVVDKSTYDAADENARGTFTGGYITGGSITGAADGNHLIGGGVNVDCGTFTMYGGTIIGNKVCINGGGVKVRGAGASFTMNGGAILANYNDCYGGAISIGDNNGNRLGSVTINGGTIARNWSGRNGGAIHADNYGHTCVITGGSIVNNYTAGYYENNSNGRSGGGIIDAGLKLKVSGSPIIKDNYNGGNVPNNIHFITNNSDMLDLSDHLTSGAEVGVYVKGLTSSADIKLATGAQKEDIEFIHFDIPDEGKAVYCDGSKDWIYFDGDVVEYKNTHHTHEAGTVWATAYVAPSVAITANGTTDYYNSFGDAVNAWTDGSTLKLLEDVSIDTKITVPAGKHTFDLNGKKFSELTNAGFRVGDGASSITDLTIIDSAGGGVIKHEGERAGSMIWIKEGSTLTLNGGTLEADSTASPVIDFFQQKNATFTINGGKITGKANNGAVRFSNSCVFNMNGGEISGLQTSTGVFDVSSDNGSVINISGSPIVQNNTVNGTVTNFNLPSGKLINISGALTEDALIGVTLAGGKGVFTNGLSGKGSADNFTSDNSAYSIYTVDGELMISDVPPEVTGVTASGYEGSYDGNAHSITVSVPEGAAVKYGEAEGSYTLTENPSYTDAGTYTVYYEVSKEGFDPAVGSATVKIDKVDAAITTAPLAKELIADGTAQELISAGTANGGTVWYALSRDSSASPADSEYKTEPPKATDAGAYYVWYLVKGDKNHNDLTPAYVKVTLAEEDWVIISGVVYDSSKTPVANVTVNLTQGSKVVDTIKSDANGGYYFKVPTGLYNLVVKTDNSTTTCKQDISESLTYDIDLLDAGTETILDIVDSDKDVVVDGLNEEARSVRENDNVPADQNVSVKLTVKAVSEDGTEGAKKIAASAADKNMEYYDLKVEKSIASEVTTLEETQNVLEIAIPCSYTNKRELMAYDNTASGVKPLTESSSKEAGTFYVDKSKQIMYVYLDHFSTIGVGYKPYYRVKSNVTLGSFSGKVSVTLTKDGSDEKYELKDVSINDISFSDVPKGSYQMTINWKDGAENTLTLPVTVK